MSDELQIQQGSSTTPYALTGGALGALGGGFGAHYLTKPKYGSYEDIIKEAQDSADFSSKVEKAEGEEKKFLEAAKDLAGKETAAGAEYDKLKEAYVNTHKDGAPQETEEFKKQVAELEDKKKAAQAKAEAKLKANNTGELTDAQKKVQETLNNKIKGVEASKSKYIADRQAAIDAFNKELEKPAKPYTYTEFGKKIKAEGNAIERVAQVRKSFETMCESIEEHLKDKKFKKGSELQFIPDKGPDKGKLVKRVPQDAHELKLAKQYFEKQYKTLLDTVFPTIKNAEIRNALLKDGVETIQNIRAVADTVDARKAYIAGEHTKLVAAEAVANDKTEINKVVGDAAKKAPKDSKIAKDFAEYTTRDFNAEIAKLDPVKDKSKIADLRRIQANLEQTIFGHYNTIRQAELGTKVQALDSQKIYKDILRSEELVNLNNSRTKNLWQKIGFKIGEWLGIPPRYLNAAENAELQEIGERLKQVKEDLKAKFGGDVAKAEAEYDKLVKDAEATTIANTEAEIKKLQSEVDALNKTVTDRAKAQKEIRRINSEVEKIAGKGARFNSAGEIILADGKTKFNPSTAFKLPVEVSAPVNDAYITKLENTIAKLKANMPTATTYTDEQIVQMAKEQVEKDLAADIKAVEDARAKLPKGEAKTAEQAAAEFVKEHGERKAYVDKAVEDAQTTFKKDFKTWIERKWGFAEHTNIKLAGAAVVGAALIGGIASALAPKNRG